MIVRFKKWLRDRLVERARDRGEVPGWWCLDVDCGFTRSWYRRLIRCGECDTCVDLDRPGLDSAGVVTYVLKQVLGRKRK